MDQYKNKTKKELIEELKTLQKRINSLQPDSAINDSPNKKVVRDITEYRNVLEEIEDGYWEVDLKGTYKFCNSAMGRILGYEREELIGNNFRMVLDKNTADQIFKHFNKVYKSRKPSKLLEYEIISKDSSRRLVEISVSLVNSPAGEVTGFLGIMRDVSERHYAEDLLESYRTMRKTLGQTVQALSLAFEARDPYTAGHHRRVSDLSRSIASELGINRDSIDGIRIAGSIHDIGKISIPSEILNKPGPLTTIEFKLIKTHPQTGYDILKKIDFPWPVATTVYQHHERSDGSGYPMGLTCKDISTEAKILAVADVVEAMASHRPYRRAIGIEIALDEISKNRGILYDRDIVAATLSIFSSKGYILKD